MGNIYSLVKKSREMTLFSQLETLKGDCEQ